jgi:hypothetical protein
MPRLQAKTAGPPGTSPDSTLARTPSEGREGGFKLTVHVTEQHLTVIRGRSSAHFSRPLPLELRHQLHEPGHFGAVSAFERVTGYYHPQ